MAAKQGLTRSSSTCPSFWVTLISINLFVSSTAGQEEQDSLYLSCVYDGGEFTDGSAYASNLNRLISSLETLEPSDNGFYNFSWSEDGAEEDRCNAIGLCIGDISAYKCTACLRRASRRIRKICPTQKEAVIWLADCMFRYANRSIFGVMDTQPSSFIQPSSSVWKTTNVTDKAEFNGARSGLLEKLKEQAAAGEPKKKYAAENSTTATGPPRIYALVQCTPDLSQQDCRRCLATNFEAIPCCEAIRRGRLVAPSCNFQFDTVPFFDIASPSSSETETTKGKGNDITRTIIVVVVPITALVVIIIVVFAFLKSKKNWPRQNVEEVENIDEIMSTKSLQLDFGDIRAATNNFSPNNKLGQGGFGSVYKGKLHDGQEIAVKRLSRNFGQGDLEFKNEVLLVAKLQHRNLVRLLGFCIEGIERLLVYEFAPNGSLDHFIFDSTKSENTKWKSRFQIIGGIAQGLLYLHEYSRLRIIHRDLKASNILLDEQMNPKIADFGMAKQFETNQTQSATERIVGTYGYMAPEYAMHGEISIKIDVFSFGVLVLEIISGKKNNYFRNGGNREDLLSFTWRNWKEGTALNIADRSLTCSSSNEILRCIHIGLLCVQEKVANRPTMAAVVQMLNSFSTSLSMPSQPAFVDFGASPLFATSRHNNSQITGLPSTVNMVSITEMYPR